LSTKIFGYLFIASAAALWGTFSVISKVLFNQAYFDPVQLTQIRAFASGIALFFILLVVNRKVLKINIRSFGIYFLLGFTIVHVQLALFFAINITDVSIASFLQYLAPSFFSS